MNRRFAAAMLLVIFGGGALRFGALETRPFHGDEAVNTAKFDEVWRTGRHRYDPVDYHGPTLSYFTLPIVWLTGARTLSDTSEATFRWLTALFALGVLALLPLLSDGLGRPATVAAGILSALSPAMTFYSRIYIHEMLLLFFTLAAVAATWRYARSQRAPWAILAGASCGLMQATKETSVIAFGCMAAGGLGALFWSHAGRVPITRLVKTNRRAIAGAAAAAVMVSFGFYSSFLMDPAGGLESLGAYWVYVGRAIDAGSHEHPFSYYVSLLLPTPWAPGPRWSEAVILALTGVGAWAAATGHGVSDARLPLLRFLALYTLTMTVVYSTLPYKTPWCIVQFLQPAILLAGVGSMALLRILKRLPLQAAFAAMWTIAVLHLGWQAYLASYRFSTDTRNPYVYAQPLAGVTRLGHWVERLSRVVPEGHDFSIQVVAPNPWPLPWTLRRCERVGYWETATVNVEADVLVWSSELEIDPGSGVLRSYHRNPSHYGLRRGVFLTVYVRPWLWERFRASAEGSPR